MEENQSRNARAGSVRVARQAGKKHAAQCGDRHHHERRPERQRVPRAHFVQEAPKQPRQSKRRRRAKDHTAGRQRQARHITSRNRLEASAPSAMRSPSSRVLCDTA